MWGHPCHRLNLLASLFVPSLIPSLFSTLSIDVLCTAWPPLALFSFSGHLLAFTQYRSTVKSGRPAVILAGTAVFCLGQSATAFLPCRHSPGFPSFTSLRRIVCIPTSNLIRHCGLLSFPGHQRSAACLTLTPNCSVSCLPSRHSCSAPKWLTRQAILFRPLLLCPSIHLLSEPIVPWS